MGGAIKRSLYICAMLLSASLVGAEVALQDDRGNSVSLAKPAQRIISLAPNITESLYAIGAGQTIVGADEFSNYPEQAQAIPRVSNYASANYEQILSLRPDLVISWYSGNGEEIVRRVRQLGLNLFVAEPRSLQDIPRLLLKLGRLTGQQQQAQQ